MEETPETKTQVDLLQERFWEETARRCEGGEAVRRCYACGMCSAGCPVAEVDRRFSPRRVIRMILLGMREQLLASNFIYLCANCQTCAERCPQGLPIPDLIRAIKNLAAEQGRLPANLRAAAQAVSRIGRLYEIEDFDNKKRVKAGLPTLKTRLTGVERLLAKKEPRNE